MPSQSTSNVPSTFSTKLVLAKYRPAGFDYLRLLLSMAVLGWHTILMTAGVDVQDQIIDHSVFRSLPELVLPMFFALSGFLVSGSLDRTKNIFDFMALRFLRILPALCLVVVLSALVMGPLVTSYSLGDYFTDPRFIRYFWTILGSVQTELPGVFEHNPFPNTVNGQLWTIPLELMCYGLLVGPALVGIYRRPKLFLAFCLIIQLGFVLRAVLLPVVYSGVPPRMLLVCFLAGSIMNVFREKIPFRFDMACLSCLITFCLMYTRGGNYFIAVPVAYLTVYIGLLNPKKVWLVRSGDYSYGIYLFAFPVQQLMASITILPQHWFINLALSLPVSILMAFLSWHIVETRALSYRRHIPQLYLWPAAVYSKNLKKLFYKSYPRNDY